VKLLLAVVLLSASVLSAQTPPPAPPPPKHEANFDAERKQADELYLAGKILDSLPLYDDLCRQDQTIAVFAERHGGGLMRKSQTLSDKAARDAMFEQGMAEIRRAQKLGDNSGFVQTVLSGAAKSPIGAIMSGVPLTPGYSYKPSAEVTASEQEAEAAFAKEDLATALKLYQRTAAMDPKFYNAALFAGDMYYRQKDLPNAAIWFQKAIAIDPDRDTAWRYWGDALFKAGQPMEAKAKYEQAVIAEPYAKPGWLSLQQWAKVTNSRVGSTLLVRPNFKTQNGVLQPDGTADTGDGRLAWTAYETCRVRHGGLTLSQPIVAGGSDANGQLTPSGYRHSLAEETECLRATLADVQARLLDGSVTPDKLDTGLKNLQQLDKDGMLQCWIVLNGADAGIRYDYPEFRKANRELLVAYLERYIVPATNH
jgi:tetratricopeptide (TPR) repeat protein